MRYSFTDPNLPQFDRGFCQAYQDIRKKEGKVFPKEFPNRVFLKKRYCNLPEIEKFLNDQNIDYFVCCYDSPGAYLRFRTISDQLIFENQFK